MTSETYLRRVAASLLHLALKVAPQDSVARRQAVLAELNYVKGDWPALAWAFGGAVVLTKRAMLSLILPVADARPSVLNQNSSPRRALCAKRPWLMSVLVL